MLESIFEKRITKKREKVRPLRFLIKHFPHRSTVISASTLKQDSYSFNMLFPFPNFLSPQNVESLEQQSISFITVYAAYSQPNRNIPKKSLRKHCLGRGTENACKTAQKGKRKRTYHREGDARQTIFTHLKQEQVHWLRYLHGNLPPRSH